MKKIYFLTLAILCATIANAAGIINIYAKKTSETSTLNLYAWVDGSGELLGSWPGTKFTETETVNGETFWKMAVDTKNHATWKLIFNNGSQQTADMNAPSTDTYYEVIKSGNSLVAESITGMNPNSTGIFLKGSEISGWNSDASYEFQKTGTDKVYAVNNVKLCGFFKIADKDWSSINIGASEENKQVTIGEATTLVNNGDSKNLYTDGTYIANVTLDMTGSNPVVTITGEKTVSGVYLKGEINAWSDNNDYQFNSLGAGIYELTKTMTTGDGQFKITANGKWFGLPGETEPVAIAVNETVTLADGKNMVLPADCTASKFELNINEDGNASLRITASNEVSYPNCLYVVGNLPGQDWNPTYGGAPLYMTETEGIYSGIITITDTGDGNGYFSIISQTGDWDTVNANKRYGAATTDEVLVPSTTAAVKSEGGNTKSWKIVAGNYEVIVNLIEMNITATVTDKKPTLPSIYLRGNVNNWEISDEYKFTETETEGIYELANVKLQGFFKIADANWSFVNVGSSDGSNLKIGQANYLINGGDSKNMSLSGTFQCDLITLDLSGDNPVVTIMGEAANSGIVVAYQGNNWGDTENSNYTYWEFEDYGKGFYSLEGDYQSTYGNFCININGVAYGIAGTEPTTIEYEESYVLTADAHKISLPEETAAYTFEINITDSDEVTLIVYEGAYSNVESTFNDAIAPAEYYNLQGVKVINPEKGIFIKRQGGKTTKIIL